MKQMVYGMCDDTDLRKEDEVAKADNVIELKDLYDLARRAKDNKDIENAQKYYEQIMMKDPSSWEARFYSIYYQSMNCSFDEIGKVATLLKVSEDAVLKLIIENICNLEDRRKAVDEVATKSRYISNKLFTAYKNYYDGMEAKTKMKYIQEYANYCSACRDINYTCGDQIVAIYGDIYGNIAAECWKQGVRQHNILNGIFKNRDLNAQVIDRYNKKILMYDTSYQAPPTNIYRDCGCYRKAFIHTYYAISPTLNKWFGHTQWFQKIWKGKLDCKVKKLQDQG